MSIDAARSTPNVQANTAPQAQLPLLSWGARGLIWTIFTLGILGGVFSWVLAFIRWNFAYSHFGPGVVWQWAAPALIAGLISFVISVGCLILWIIRRDHRASAEVSGLILQRGQRTKTYPWEWLRDLRLTVVQYGFPFWKWGAHSTAELSTREGELLRFRGRLEELEIFTNAIKYHLYPLRLREYRRALLSKEEIPFGPLRCSTQGIKLGKNLYTWDQIHAVDLNAGYLRITISKSEGEQSLRIPSHKIPNPDLCAQLLNNIEY